MSTEPFGKKVRERRAQEGLSQEELAMKAGISRNYLSQIERGQATNLSWQVMDRLTAVLGLRAEEDMSAVVSWESLPEGLAEFARAANLPDADIVMLARLQYRGQRPKTRQQWQVLYSVIKATIES